MTARRPILLLVLVSALVAAVAGPSPARAFQQPAINVTVDRTQVTVGDRIVVTVVLRLPEAAQPDLAALETQFGDLDLLVIGLAEERLIGGGQKEIRIRYEVAAFAPGDYQLPPLTVSFTGPDGQIATASSAAIPIAVESVIPPDVPADDVRDLKEQIELPLGAGGVSRRVLLAVAAFVLAVLLAAALAAWLLWRSRRPAVPVPAPAAPLTTPEAVARAELDRIAGLGLIDEGKLVEFHNLLAACIRRYLTDRYGFPAFAMTTSELRSRMEHHGVGRWQARLATGLLSECDAVAYARYAPASARAESNLSMAYEIVSLTEEESLPPVPVTAAGV